MLACLVTHVHCVIDPGVDASWSCALLVGQGGRALWPLPRPLHWPGRVQFSQLMRWRTQVEWRAQGERLSVCERLLIVWRWICSTHTGSGLCGCGGMSLMSLCAFWCCPGYAVLLASFVDFCKVICAPPHILLVLHLKDIGMTEMCGWWRSSYSCSWPLPSLYR